jgi:sterol desaturase/sphingolipid hydroxylase (fatty acid hydroxylase superfamily)
MNGAIKPAAILSALLILGILETTAPFYRDHKERLAHGFSNLLMALINGMLGTFPLAPLTVWIVGKFSIFHKGLFSSVGFSPPVRIIAAFLLLDMITYFWHRINHRVRFLWYFHRAHHTDTQMDSTTALRFHPGEIILSACFRIPFLIVFNFQPLDILIYETILNICVIYHHSNWSISEKIDSVLRWFIVTPYMHRYHHSANLKECHSNYTSIFSVWDRLFGTYTRPEMPENLKIGLNILSETKWQRPVGILLTPFLPLSDRYKKRS